ncbi:MAG: hypothetical protein ACXW39_10600 [Nitrospira sp.]
MLPKIIATHISDAAGAGSAEGTVTPVNDAPVNAVPLAQSINEDIPR